MECKIFIITLLSSFFGVNYILCHLKDMGEKKVNWTKNILSDIEMKIVNGGYASLKQFPFNVQFFNLGSLCGGTILTMKAVMTAAHCFDHNKNIAEMLVISNPRFVFDPHADPHDVWDFKIHEKYNEEIFCSSDIAIILIHDKFVFSEHVQKVMLTTTFTWMREDEKFIATGWGETEYGEPVEHNKLKEVELRYVSAHECMELARVNLTRDMFCLYGEGGRDTCRGDSGGGIIWRGVYLMRDLFNSDSETDLNIKDTSYNIRHLDNDHFTQRVLVGMTSHGRGCGQAPGVYVNICYFNKWIKDTVALLTTRYCEFHIS